MTVTVHVVRPGAARTRRECEIYVLGSSCLTCGYRLTFETGGPVLHEGDAVWEVLGRCYRCDSLQRTLFEAGPGWTGGRTFPKDLGAIGNPGSPSPLIALGPGPSAILDAGRLVVVRDEALSELVVDCPLDQPDNPEDDDWGRGAFYSGRRVLEALYELDRLAAAGRWTPDPGHAALEARVEGMFVAAGGVLPTPEQRA